MNTTRQCSEQLWRSGVWSRTFPCKRAGKVERDGQWYCTQHDPVRVEEREQKSRERWKRRAAKWRLEAAAPDLLEALRAYMEHGCMCAMNTPEQGKCEQCERSLAAIAKAEGER